MLVRVLGKLEFLAAAATEQESAWRSEQPALGLLAGVSRSEPGSSVAQAGLSTEELDSGKLPADPTSP